MRPKLVLVAALTVATSVAPGASPAGADGPTIVVHFDEFPDLDVAGRDHVGCDSPFDVSGTPTFVRIERGPGTPPLGQRTWGWQTDTQDDAYGLYFVLPSLAALATAAVRLHSPSAVEGVAYVYVADVEDPDLTWVGRSAIAEPAGDWREVEVADDVYTWRLWDFAELPGTPIGEQLDPMTIDGFLAATGGDRGGQVTIAFGCSGDRFSTDAWVIGTEEGVTTYDLEGARPELKLNAAKTSIVAGESTMLNGTFRVNGEPLGIPLMLNLQTRVPPATTFAKQRTVAVDEAGVISTGVSPNRTTVYRVHFPGNDPIIQGRSHIVVIQVATKVSIVLNDSAVTRGKTIVAAGATMPKKPGVEVNLWRQTKDGPEEAAEGVVKADGTYRLAKVLDTLGEWRLFVTVAPADGNVRGTSPTKVVTVSRP